MANLTERNGLVLSCKPSLNAHIFIYFFFLQFMFLFCFVLFLFLLIFQADTSLFLFHLIVENLILHIFLIIMIIIPCSGMFRNVPCCGFYRRPQIQTITTCGRHMPKHRSFLVKQSSSVKMGTSSDCFNFLAIFGSLRSRKGQRNGSLSVNSRSHQKLEI